MFKVFLISFVSTKPNAYLLEVFMAHSAVPITLNTLCYLCVKRMSIQERVVAANIGRSSFGPKIQPNGSLILEYVNGGACIDVDNTTKTYSLTVILHCDLSEKNLDSSVGCQCYIRLCLDMM